MDNNYDVSLLEYAVVNQLESDFYDNDFAAMSEMITLLLESESNREILFNYLSDSAQENLKSGETFKRY